MSADTEPGDLNAGRRRIRFDMTINLGHVLTLAGVLLVMAGAYNDIDKRLAAQEVRMLLQEREMEAERARTVAATREIREDLREMRKGIEKLLERRP